EIEQDRARFEHRDRRAATCGLVVNDGGNAVVGRELKERALKLFSLANVHGEDFIRQSGLFEKDRHLVAVGRRPVMHVDHVTVPLPLACAAGSGLTGRSTALILDDLTAAATRAAGQLCRRAMRSAL